MIVGGSVAIPAASFTITRRLYKISRIHGVATIRSEVRTFFNPLADEAQIFTLEHRNEENFSLICYYALVFQCWLCLGVRSTCLNLEQSFELICPLLVYVVQASRYAIVERVGCAPFIVNTPLLYVLILMWPLVFGVCSMALCRECSFIEMLKTNTTEQLLQHSSYAPYGHIARK